jgi:CHAD domain-containing protein
VATRRLRAFLRACHDLLDPETSEPLRAELRWLGSTLGPVRDLDVLVEHLAAEVSELGDDEKEGRKLVRALERSRRSARRRMLVALDSERYFALLDSLERPFATVADEPSLDEIRAAEHKKLRKAVKELAPDSPDVELHAARIRVKRARYAAELEGDKAYVQAAKRLQDILGEHQDAVVAIGKLRDLANRMPAAALAAGRLIEREQRRERATRGAWRTSWKRLAKTV